MENYRELVIKDKIAGLTFEELLQTEEILDESWEMGSIGALNEMFNMAQKAGLEPQIDDIYVPKNGVEYHTPRQFELDKKIRRDGDTLVSRFDLRLSSLKNYIARIGFRKEGLADDKTHMSVAINFNKNSFLIAMGTHVNICSNMNILQPGRIFEVKGRKMKENWKAFINTFATWLENIYIERQYELGVLKQLENYRVPEPIESLDRMIGQLTRRIEMDLMEKTDTLVVRHGNVLNFLRRCLKGISDNNEDNKITTAYDFYQWLTEVTTHQHVVENRIMNTYRSLEFIKEYFGLEFMQPETKFEEMIEQRNRTNPVPPAVAELPFTTEEAQREVSHPVAEEVPVVESSESATQEADTWTEVPGTGMVNEDTGEIISEDDIPSIEIDD